MEHSCTRSCQGVSQIEWHWRKEDERKQSSNPWEELAETPADHSTELSRLQSQCPVKTMGSVGAGCPTSIYVPRCISPRDGIRLCGCRVVHQYPPTVEFGYGCGKQKRPPLNTVSLKVAQVAPEKYAMEGLFRVPEKPLDDNPEIFDDRYKDCRLKMDKVIPDILKSEMQSNKEFKKSWEDATNRWKGIKPTMELPEKFKDEYGIAVIVYTGDMYESFNDATRAVGASLTNYKNDYHFKALHYYLTMAVDMLGNKEKSTLVYRGVKSIHFVPSKNSSGFIRFGQFTSSSEDIKVAKQFGTASFFIMQTRYGANIRKLSNYQSEKELLIPGYEIFKIKSFKEQTHEFTLESTGETKNLFECAYFKAQIRGPLSSCPGESRGHEEAYTALLKAAERQADREAAQAEQKREAAECQAEQE
ncbi:ecto-ADP-ribosyltransferase 5-like [Dendrobates tinctorius]|uniref:ecto-ADP-ribosyltransferase 5-like n=1 Tax=Dendrobates tinctorius TaxID=92724 RepID=UPI003CC933D7